MATFDVDRLLRRIRQTIGSPGTCEVSDEWLEDILDDAICRYSRYNPIRETVEVQLVECQSNYAFPPGYFDVDHTVRVGENALAVPDLTGYGYGNAAYYHTLGGTNLHETTMNGRMALDTIEAADRVFPPRKFWERGGQLVAEPPPSKTGACFVPLLKYHDRSTFPSMHADELRLLASAMALRERVALIGKFTEVKMTRVQVVKFRDPKWLTEQAEYYEQQAAARMGALGFGAVLS